MPVRSLDQEDPLENHSSIVAWKIPWTEEPGGLQSTGSQSRTRLRALPQEYVQVSLIFPFGSLPASLFLLFPDTPFGHFFQYTWGA